MSEANETGRSRVDSEGRDVTDMPGLHSEDDMEVRFVGTRLNPFLLCRKCSNGEYRSKPTSSWVNRWKCDKCGHCCSK